jgi:DNA-binding CsgD family transcriptional regulator
MTEQPTVEGPGMRATEQSNLSTWSQLTSRQAEVVQEVRRQGGIRPAARALEVNPGTVKQHLKRAEEKGVQ